MTKALSLLMQRALAFLPAPDQPGKSSYRMRLSLATLYALEDRGLVRAQRGLGSGWSPATNITWRLTPAGVEARNKETTNAPAQD